jgi:hypothetical protein
MITASNNNDGCTKQVVTGFSALRTSMLSHFVAFTAFQMGCLTKLLLVDTNRATTTNSVYLSPRKFFGVCMPGKGTLSISTWVIWSTWASPTAYVWAVIHLGLDTPCTCSFRVGSYFWDSSQCTHIPSDRPCPAQIESISHLSPCIGCQWPWNGDNIYATGRG